MRGWKTRDQIKWRLEKAEKKARLTGQNGIQCAQKVVFTYQIFTLIGGCRGQLISWEGGVFMRKNRILSFFGGQVAIRARLYSSLLSRGITLRWQSRCLCILECDGVAPAILSSTNSCNLPRYSIANFFCRQRILNIMLFNSH